MNRHRLLDIIGEAQESYIQSAMEARTARRHPRGSRVLLIAAAVSLALLLVGCGIVYLMNMQSLKLEDREWTDEWIYTEGPVTQRVISTGGPQGTDNYKAAKEWQDFEVPYAQTHDWDENFIPQPEYEAYYVYSREMEEKLEEILNAYGLKPLGPQIVGETETGLQNYLGIREILLPDAPAKAKDLSVSYYEGGKLSTFCRVQMEPEEGRWPYETYTVCTFTPKGYFDNGLFILDNPEQWQEWNYTTASGECFLILYNPDHYEAYALCDQGDRMVAVYMETAKQLYTNNRVSDERMNPRQVEQLLDVFDFSLTPQPGDPALLTGLPAGYDASQRIQSIDGYTVELKEALCDGNIAWVRLGITLPEGIAEAHVNESSGKTYWNLRFGGLRLQCRDTAFGSRASYQELDDGDGRDNTLEYVITWTKESADEKMEAGASWSVTLEKMYQRLNNPATDKMETRWEKDGVGHLTSPLIPAVITAHWSSCPGPRKSPQSLEKLPMGMISGAP